jgi:hypothetical protein
MLNNEFPCTALNLTAAEREKYKIRFFRPFHNSLTDNYYSPQIGLMVINLRLANTILRDFFVIHCQLFITEKTHNQDKTL